MSLVDQARKSVSAGKLAEHAKVYNYPKVVPGRVAHIDADFMAYQVSAESKAELDPQDSTPRRSLEDMQHNAGKAVLHITKLCGADTFHLHTTPSGGNKGNRGDYAVLKEYQANRKSSAEKPEFLNHIRAWMVSSLHAVEDVSGTATAHLDQEADDGMSQAAWAAHWAGTPELVVIASKDKDLLMCPGWHLLSDDKLYETKGTFGHIAIDDSKSSKKCVGLGTKFFWAQLLKGDAADNISGIPAVTGRFTQAAAPTAAYTKDLNAWIACTGQNSEQLERLNTKLDIMHAATKKCGEVLAHTLLKDVKTDAECYRLIKSMYMHLGETGHVFEHWKTGKVVTPTQAMLSDMILLWMRRRKKDRDCVAWLKEVLAK